MHYHQSAHLWFDTGTGAHGDLSFYSRCGCSESGRRKRASRATSPQQHDAQPCFDSNQIPIRLVHIVARVNKLRAFAYAGSGPFASASNATACTCSATFLLFVYRADTIMASTTSVVMVVGQELAALHCRPCCGTCRDRWWLGGSRTAAPTSIVPVR